jgi:hypothetical protein
MSREVHIRVPADREDAHRWKVCNPAADHNPTEVCSLEACREWERHNPQEATVHNREHCNRSEEERLHIRREDRSKAG